MATGTRGAGGWRRADGGGSPEKGNVGSLGKNTVLTKTVSDR